MRHKLDLVVLALADAISFLVAGIASVMISLAFDKLTTTEELEVLSFSTRYRFTDLVFGYLIWALWFLLIKRRFTKRAPFWSEAIESTKTILLFAIVDLALIAITRSDFSRSLWLTGWISLIPVIPLTRSLMRSILLSCGVWERTTWVIGNGENALEAKAALESEWLMGYRVSGLLDPQEILSSNSKSVEEGSALHNLLLADSGTTLTIALDENESNLISRIIDELTLRGFRDILIVPSFRGIPLYGTEVSYLYNHEVLLLAVRNNLESGLSRVIKRTFDFLLAGLLAIPTFILLIPFLILIYLEDGSPVFYTQERLGFGGKPFRMIKLRSMRRDAEEILASWKETDSLEWSKYVKSNFKLQNDPRLLSIGKFIRRSSMDELPQLFNVLRGEMSLVGPRPLLPREEDLYGTGYALYKAARPGITGLWQVSGRSATSFDQREALDVWYIRNWSLGFDLIILIRTISVVLFSRGAY